MNLTINSKFEKLIPVIYYYFKKEKPSAGVMDFAQICGEIINHLEESSEISRNEKAEYIERATTLIGYSFPKGLPSFVLQQIAGYMDNVQGCSALALKLWNECR